MDTGLMILCRSVPLHSHQGLRRLRLPLQSRFLRGGRTAQSEVRSRALSVAGSSKRSATIFESGQRRSTTRLTSSEPLHRPRFTARRTPFLSSSTLAGLRWLHFFGRAPLAFAPISTSRSRLKHETQMVPRIRRSRPTRRFFDAAVCPHRTHESADALPALSHSAARRVRLSR